MRATFSPRSDDPAVMSAFMSSMEHARRALTDDGAAGLERLLQTAATVGDQNTALAVGLAGFEAGHLSVLQSWAELVPERAEHLRRFRDFDLQDGPARSPQAKFAERVESLMPAPATIDSASAGGAEADVSTQSATE